jgi:hypothetical protein
MEAIYSETGLVHAEEDEAPTRPEPSTLDEVLGHPTPAHRTDDEDGGPGPSSIDREIFGFLVTP